MRRILFFGMIVSILSVGLLMVPALSWGGGRADTLVIGMNTGDAVSLDPARAYEFSSVTIVEQLYDRLVEFLGGDFTKVQPGLAESWDVEGDLWTFHLRKGLRFPSGTPINAEAVAFSLGRVATLKQTASWLVTQFGINDKTIKVVDDHTVQIKVNGRYAPGLFLSTLAFTTGSIVDPVVVKQHEQNGDLGSAWMTDHSAGSGPYSLEKWERNAVVILRANEQYWRGAPKLKRIIIRDIPEPTNQQILLEKGDIDVAWNLLADQVKAIEGKPGIKIAKGPTFRLMYVGMNVGVKPLSDNRVRNAIRYAIDYDGIVNNILKGSAIKVQTFIPKGLMGYNPALPYEKDIARARQLLAEAGYPDGFEIELTTPPIPPFVDIATKIQSDLAEAGIKAKVVQMVASQMYEKYRAQGLQLVLAQWGVDYADPDANAKPFAHCNSIGPDAKIKQLAWRNKYLNLETSALVEKAAQELDVEKRKAYYKKLTDIILREGPYAIFAQPLLQIAYRENVHGVMALPLAYHLNTWSKE
ncbi:MAG: ABC transporter substrate-binding protein [Nitrospinota bacterium]|nr:MAG: ABC transporter substrate-binding protein [Nitrospinota bacterium]